MELSLLYVPAVRFRNISAISVSLTWYFCRGKTHRDLVDASEQEGPDEESEGGSEDDVEEDPEVSNCRMAGSRAALHMALWCQMANGNRDMDLRR